MLFADTSNGDRPVWVAASLAVIGIAYALFRFFFWLKTKRRTLDEAAEDSFIERKKKARRDAAEEAWEVVDRLTAIVESHTSRIAELEIKHAEQVAEIEKRERAANDRVARCEAEHGETRGRMIVLEAWARSKGLKIPDRISGGSDLHRPLSAEDVK